MTEPAQLKSSDNLPPTVVGIDVSEPADPTEGVILVEEGAETGLIFEVRVLDLNEDDVLTGRWFVDWTSLAPGFESADDPIADPLDRRVRIFTFALTDQTATDCHKVELIVSDRGFASDPDRRNRVPDPEGYSLTEVWYVGVFRPGEENALTLDTCEPE